MEDKNMMDWNDTIESDGQEFVLLEEGDYNFVVTNFERGRFPGGQKVPACNKATITVQVKTKEGVCVVRFDLLLYRTLEWRIASFFRCIGQKKTGEKLVMDWNKVVALQKENLYQQQRRRKDRQRYREVLRLQSRVLHGDGQPYRSRR